MSRSRWRPSDMTESAKPAPPCVFVIFGAAGDLTRRLLMPALYNLRRGKLLSDDFRIIGVARGDKSDEAFRHDFDAGMRQFAEGAENGAEWKWLRERVSYLKGDLQGATTYRAAGEQLSTIAKRIVLCYRAPRTSLFEPVVTHLCDARLLQERAGGWRRVTLETPFGTALRSAKALNCKILSVMS